MNIRMFRCINPSCRKFIGKMSVPAIAPGTDILFNIGFKCYNCGMESTFDVHAANTNTPEQKKSVDNVLPGGRIMM